MLFDLRIKAIHPLALLIFISVIIASVSYSNDSAFRDLQEADTLMLRRIIRQEEQRKTTVVPLAFYNYP